MKYIVTRSMMLLLASLVPLFSQWQPDVRLTYDDSMSHTSVTNARCIAAAGDSVHVVWYDSRHGGYEIYYLASTDGGTTWGSETRLTNNISWSINPTISVQSTYLHVAWRDNRDADAEIYYKRSTDGGGRWGPDTRLTNFPSWADCPALEAVGPYVHLVWYDNRDGNEEIYYKRSTDYGASWGSDRRLTSAADYSRVPSLTVSNPYIHVTWWDHYDGNDEIYYKRSSDNGLTWGSDVRLTNDPVWSGPNCVAASGQYVHVTWEDNRDGNDEIYYKRSTNSGISWGTDTRLTYNSLGSYRPNVFASGSFIHILWFDYRDGNAEIYYKRSTDNGITWESDTRLTSDARVSNYPFIAAAGTKVHALWYDDRDRNEEIYYKRNLTGNIGIKETTSENLVANSLVKVNPLFHDRLTLEFARPSTEPIGLSIYNVYGAQVFKQNLLYTPSTLVISAKNIRHLTSGIYMLIVSADNRIPTVIKLIKY